MSNASFVITLTSPRSVADLARFIKAASEPREESRALQNLFERLKGGLEIGSFVVQTSASAPVRATNTVTLTYANITDQDTVIIAGTTLKCVTGTPSGIAEFKKQTDATVTAANLVACVNAHATLSLLMKATNVLGVVTLTLHTAGAIGNQVPLVGSTGMVRGAAAFATGAGGCEIAPTNSYSRGL